MAGKAGSATDPLVILRALHETPYAFDFFQALRRIECAFPDKPRIGEAKRLADDALRFGQEPSLAFAPSTLRVLEMAGEKHAARLLVSFFGLLGPNGPLPLHLTEYVRERQRHHGDATLMRFLDIFHHRLISLFYSAWARAQPCVSLDRPDHDHYGAHLGALAGLGLASLRQRDSVPDYAKLAHAGLFARQVRNAEGLSVILAGFFNLPVRAEQCVGHWLPLPQDARTRLGKRETTAQLGVTAVAGERIWDVQSKFRIVLGPLTLRDYERFLPGRESLRRLTDWVRNYLGIEYYWDVQLLLKKDEVPLLWLGNRAYLGWTTWLGMRGGNEDAGDLVMRTNADVV